MTQQDRESSQSLDSAEVGSDAATQARGDTNDLIDYLFSQLDPHPSVEPEPLLLTPIPISEWSEYAKRCREEIKAAGGREGPLWCGIPQD